MLTRTAVFLESVRVELVMWRTWTVSMLLACVAWRRFLNSLDMENHMWSTRFIFLALSSVWRLGPLEIMVLRM